MRLRSGRIIGEAGVKYTDYSSSKSPNLRKLYFDYDSDSDSEYTPRKSSTRVNNTNNNINNTNTNNNNTNNSNIERKPYQTYVLNRIHTFLEIKSKYNGSYEYYIEMARVITELYSSMNTYFDDWIYDMYYDINYSKSVYKILKIVNEKARIFIQYLMNELTTSPNRLYRKQENIKILHCALNEMREFVNWVEQYILD